MEKYQIMTKYLSYRAKLQGKMYISYTIIQIKRSIELKVWCDNIQQRSSVKEFDFPPSLHGQYLMCKCNHHQNELNATIPSQLDDAELITNSYYL